MNVVFLELENTEICADLMRFGFIFGIIVSLFLYDRFHLGTGSLIVPGFFAALMFKPLILVQCLVVSVMCFIIVHKMLSRFLILMPSTKFSLLILVSVLTQFLFGFLHAFQTLNFQMDNPDTTIGFLLPGLIAHEISRQGPIKAFSNIGFSTCMVCLVLTVVMCIPIDGEVDSVNETENLFAFDQAYMPFMLSLSVVVSITLKHSRGLKTGGFVSAAYVAMLLGHPIGSLVLAFLAILTFSIVKKLLMPYLLLFGRRKFAAMLLVGALVSWSALLITDILKIGSASALCYSNFSVMSILIAGLIANDIERAGIKNVSKGLFLNVAIVANVALLVDQLLQPMSQYSVPILTALLFLQCLYLLWPFIEKILKQQITIAGDSNNTFETQKL